MTTYSPIFIREVTPQKILSPTSIHIAPFVINPYKGCPVGCLYCYTRSNKNLKKRNEKWGTFCDVKTGSPSLLIAELEGKDPTRILLGSTCECYNPLEVSYQLTRQLLQIIHEHGSSATILTRSPLIQRDRTLLGQMKDSHIYFTFNHISDHLIQKFQRITYAFSAQLLALKKLLQEGCAVTVYISPYFHQPFLIETLLKKIYETVPQRTKLSVAIEVYNFQAGNWPSLRPIMQRFAPHLFSHLQRIYQNEEEYEKALEELAILKKSWENDYSCSITVFAPPWKVFYSQMAPYEYEEPGNNQSRSK